MKDVTKKWVAFARGDLEAAELQFQHGGTRGSAYQIAVFHCHQAIEKILKAHIVEQDKEVKKSHDLTQLRALTGLSMPDHLVECIDNLQPHYLIPRYPDLPFKPSFTFTYNRANTKIILNQTQELLLWLEQKLTQKK